MLSLRSELSPACAPSLGGRARTLAEESHPLAAELRRQGSQIADSTRQAAFVRQLADGSLPERAFLWYLSQNALFLTGYATALRASLQAAGPPVATELISELEASISGAAIPGHGTEYQARSGRPLDLAGVRPSPVAIAYVQHLQAAAAVGQAALLFAVLPGEQSYAAAGQYYAAAGDLTAGNPYADWISPYVSGHIDELVSAIVERLETAAVSERPSWGAESLQAYYRPSVPLDGQFWVMASQPAEI